MKAKRKELAKHDLDRYGSPAPMLVTVRQEIQTRERRGTIVEGEPAEAAEVLPAGMQLVSQQL